MRLGIDFGSTYSTMSGYNTEKDEVFTLTIGEGESSSIPSIVSVSRKKNAYVYGNAGKNRIGKPAFLVFEAFKMLLVETDKQQLRLRGYSDEYSPRKITKDFLSYLLHGAISRYGSQDHVIQELVLCVPEVWCSSNRRNLSGMNGKNLLRDIIRNEIVLPDGWSIHDIKIVTEPEAASAYFAYNYEQEMQKNNTAKRFNGHLLLIDYGGGTLDITLTNVTSHDGKALEIGYRDSGGVGENHFDEAGNLHIGNAGIAYMQRVTELVIHDNTDADEVIEFSSAEFQNAFHELEDALKEPHNIQNLEFEFGKYGDYSNFCEILEEEPKEFCVICYQGDEFAVNYQHLYQAYRETIEGTLKQQLDFINPKVARCIHADPCTIESGLRDDFKIAIVGGFGSFFLVRKQIACIYNIDSNEQNDLRLKNVNSDKAEQAIALGAGLIAAGRVELQKVARFSIGLMSRSTANNRIISYGIRFHQRIQPGKPYYLLTGNAEEDTVTNRIIYGGIHKNITHFAVEYSNALNRGMPMAIKDRFLREMNRLPDTGLWYCAFSMDENDIISFHVVPIEQLKNQYEGITIRLDNYQNLFDLTGGEEVYADET